MRKHKFTFVDLFAGIGGFHHALSAEDGDCVLAIENNLECQNVYRTSFPKTRLEGDIRSITRNSDGTDRTHDLVDSIVPDHDVLCAGFPCQPFSKSGAQLGIRDKTRGTLFHDVMSIVIAKKPKFVILENVRNLSGKRHIDTWNGIIDSLRSQGYMVSDIPLVLSPHRLSPKDGGAPQIRDRVYILAFRPDRPYDFDNEPLMSRELSKGWSPDDWRIEDYLDDDCDIENLDEYKLTDKRTACVEAWQAFVQQVEDDHISGQNTWSDYFYKNPKIPSDTPKWKKQMIQLSVDYYAKNKSSIDPWLKTKWSNGLTIRQFEPSYRKFEWHAVKAQPTRAERDLTKLVFQFRPSGLRVKPATYLPALVVATQVPVIGSRMRKITPREAARLQGLPDNIFAKAKTSDHHAYKQLGNAVNVGVVRTAAKALFEEGQASWLNETKTQLRRVV